MRGGCDPRNVILTQLTCYGGVDEIGGNKFLLEDGEHRVMLDFGKAFGRYGAYFDGVFVKERVARGLLDPLALGLIPPLRGIYREDLIPSLDPADLEIRAIPPSGSQRKARTLIRLLSEAKDAFWREWERRDPTFRDLRRASAPAVDFVYLSHAHQDHISDLEYVSPEIPAWGSRLTAFISKVLLDTGQVKSGAAYVSSRQPQAEGALETIRDAPLAARPWRFLGSAEAPEEMGAAGPLDSATSFWGFGAAHSLTPVADTSAGRISLRHWPVDHSLFGALGAALETGAGWVAYTGDLRFHGEQAAASWDYADALAALGTRALLCEGTRLDRGPSASESEVAARCLEVVRRSAGRLVVADFAPRNVERLIAFLGIAIETGRRLLVQPKDAYLLRAIHLADPGVPDVMAQSAAGVYADPKVRSQAWEAMVRERYRGITVGPEEVNRAPGDFVLAFSLTDVADLLDLDFLRGGVAEGVYIFSNSPAYDDEQMADLVRLWNWTQRLGLEMVGLRPNLKDTRGRVVEIEAVPGYHASGHAGQSDLVEFVRRVRPETLIPVHTESAGMWVGLLQGTGIEVVEPSYAQAIRLR